MLSACRGPPDHWHKEQATQQDQQRTDHDELLNAMIGQDGDGDTRHEDDDAEMCDRALDLGETHFGAR